MSSTSFGVLGVLLLATAVPALAQDRPGQPPVIGDGAEPYRDGLPPVLDAPAAAPDAGAEARARFQRAYARARAPRVVIFWNREFTGEIATRYERYARLRTRTVTGAAGADATRYGPDTVASRSAGVAVSSSDTELRTGVERVSDDRTGSFHYEAYDFDIEQGFSGALERAGVRLVDRTSIIRTAGATAGADETTNLQSIETQAILAKAELVVEVVQMLDPRKPDGIAYRVIVRNLRTGRTLASLSTSGLPPERQMPLVAGSRGWVRAAQPVAGPIGIGKQIATEMMAMLAGTI